MHKRRGRNNKEVRKNRICDRFNSLLRDYRDKADIPDKKYREIEALGLVFIDTPVGIIRVGYPF